MSPEFVFELCQTINSMTIKILKKSIFLICCVNLYQLNVNHKNTSMHCTKIPEMKSRNGNRNSDIWIGVYEKIGIQPTQLHEVANKIVKSKRFNMGKIHY